MSQIHENTLSQGGCAAIRADSRMSTKQIAICALLCALNVVFARFFTVMPSAVARFSIEAVPIVLAGYFYGPVAGMMVGFVGDTVGCLFSSYGWDPILSVSPMLMGLFAGLLRPLAYQVKKPWDIWKVAVTILPGKVLGSVFWTSQCLVWLGYSQKGLGVMMGARSIEAGLEWALDTLVVFLLMRTGLFRRAKLFPPERKRDKRSLPNVLRLCSGGLLIAQVAVLVLGSVTFGLGFLNPRWSLAGRIGNAFLYALPALAAVLLFLVALVLDKKRERKQCHKA